MRLWTSKGSGVLEKCRKCVCVCVCVREREREMNGLVSEPVFHPWQKMNMQLALIIPVLVTREVYVLFHTTVPHTKGKANQITLVSSTKFQCYNLTSSTTKRTSTLYADNLLSRGARKSSTKFIVKKRRKKKEKNLNSWRENMKIKLNHKTIKSNKSSPQLKRQFIMLKCINWEDRVFTLTIFGQFSKL